MKIRSRVIAVFVYVLMLAQTAIPIKGCGPETLAPIFVFTSSPDLPFEEFTRGKIGIVRPTLGRKTLIIAHRYLNGGAFTADEQTALIDALKGKAPESEDEAVVKAWITARKVIVGEEKQQPAIYDERRHNGYDFFPNCASDAFKVATQTLNDRVSSYGATDPNVRNWLEAQDIVFRNCAEGSLAPANVDSGSPKWLQKDRDYQTAAASFYSLNFDEARLRFQKIAEDSDSVWQDTAQYLVGRTLVRAASLANDEKVQRGLYQQAEVELTNVNARGGKFQSAAKRLIALVKYRLRPEERVVELGQILAEQTGNENVRQDLIDYTWLIDKFDAQTQKEEEERQKQLNPSPSPEPTYQPDPAYLARQAAIESGELIVVWFSPKKPDGEADYTKSLNLEFKAGITEADVIQEVEIDLARKLTPVELDELKVQFAAALSRRQFGMSPNRKFPRIGDYEGCNWDCSQLKLNSFPLFLRADELSDWILTFQSSDPTAFDHAQSKWRQSQSTAWLVNALTHATAKSRSITRLMSEAERVPVDTPAYASVAYQLVRLRTELNQTSEARKILDEIVPMRLDSLPVSSQNLFLEQRMKLAGNVSEFLKFASRKPAAYWWGSIGSIKDLKQNAKSYWDEKYYTETKEEYDRGVDEKFADLVIWEDRFSFDPQSADILNWHFPLRSLLDASRDPALPDYLRRSLTLTVWTRAILLNDERVALSAARDVVDRIPEVGPQFSKYLAAKTSTARTYEAIDILLKYSSLSPYVVAGIPEFSTAEEQAYYFEVAWWCMPADTDYNRDGTETPHVVAAPSFIDREGLAEAKRERARLLELGEGKRWLGKKTLEWAKQSPNDPRLAEALFIAVKANESYKYGCSGWDFDEPLRTELESTLRERYPQSSWTAKLRDN
jgi:hypothetical protein